MLEFEWNNLDAAIAALIKEEVEPIVKGLAATAWMKILRYTPQKYGRLAASWSYSLGEPLYVDRSQTVPSSDDKDDHSLPIFWAGHKTAVNIANSFAVGRDSAFKLGDTIWFANGADHGDGPYSSFIENVDQSWLRLYNRPGHAVVRSMEFMETRFGEDVSASAAARLKQTKIGGSE